MGAPAGFLPLGLVGFTDRGKYNAAAIYMMNDLVHVNNAIWKCKVDNTTGIAPAENANWELWIQSSTELAGIVAVDDSGVLGAAGQVVVSQELISAMANMIMKELIKKSKIVNNLLATDTSTVLAGPMGKQLAEKDAALQKQINDTNSNLIIKSFSKEVVFPGGKLTYFDIPLAPPAGYTPVMVTLHGNGYNADAVGWVVGYTAKNVALVAKNHLADDYTRTITIDVLFKRN